MDLQDKALRHAHYAAWRTGGRSGVGPRGRGIGTAALARLVRTLSHVAAAVPRPRLSRSVDTLVPEENGLPGAWADAQRTHRTIQAGAA